MKRLARDISCLTFLAFLHTVAFAAWVVGKLSVWVFA